MNYIKDLDYLNKVPTNSLLILEENSSLLQIQYIKNNCTNINVFD